MAQVSPPALPYMQQPTISTTFWPSTGAFYLTAVYKVADTSPSQLLEPLVCRENESFRFQSHPEAEGAMIEPSLTILTL